MTEDSSNVHPVNDVSYEGNTHDKMHNETEQKAFTAVHNKPNS